MKKTLVVQIDPISPEPQLIHQAAEILRTGGLVVFPTETVYGLGANALDADAVQAIFAAKERPAYDPLIVHLLNVERLSDIAQTVPVRVYELAEHFWPGPLTIILPRHTQVPLSVTAGGDTVAVRVPGHPIAQALIEAAGVPVAAPSANRFGRISPTCAEHVLDDLEGRVDMLLDGGPTSVGVESTVLSLLTSPPMILRPGGVSREALMRILGDVQVLARPVSSKQIAPSPGTMLQHYAPQAQLTLYRGSRDTMLSAMRAEAAQLLAQGKRVGILVAREDVATFDTLSVEIEVPGSQKALEDIARGLFAALHKLDDHGVVVILARDFGEAGLGLAIRDRLIRAAGGRVIDV